MAFNLEHFAPVGNQSRRGKAPQYYVYRTTDTLADVLGSNYFDDVKTMLELGDIVDVQFADNVSTVTEAQGTTRLQVGVKFAGVIQLFEMSNNKKILFTKISDVSTASTTAVTSSVSGYITKITTVLGGAITGADDAITFDIDGTEITGSAITVANAGSAAGNIDTASPTGLRQIAPGSVITATTDGASTGEFPLYIVYEVTDAAAAVSTAPVYLTTYLADVSTASSAFVVSPIAGKVTKIWSVLFNGITVADAVVTSKIGGANITNGGFTVTQAGSAAGDVDVATPTAANTVTAGGAIEIATDGASTTTAPLMITVEITPN